MELSEQESIFISEIVMNMIDIEMLINVELMGIEMMNFMETQIMKDLVIVTMHFVELKIFIVETKKCLY